MRALPLAFIAILLAGCTSGGPSGGIPFLPPAKASEISFSIVSLKHDGGEPTLGIDGSGRINVISDTAIFQSADNGSTWKDVAPTPGNWPVGSLDPFLYVDRDTGRIFADHLYVGCSYLLTSDDAGGSWSENPAACGRPGNDHQSVVTANATGSATTRLYPKVVYYGYNDAAPIGLGALPTQGATSVARSLDGGLTWEPSVIAIGADHCGGLSGHMKAFTDGTVYMPAAGCKEPVVSVTHDSGATWTISPIDTQGRERSTPGDDPSIAIDSKGNAYFVWPGKDARMYGVISRDQGKTWSAPFAVSPAYVNSSLEAASVAGTEGRVAFAYYGTKDSVDAWKSVNSDDATDNTRWHLYVTYSLNALDASPTWTTVQVTPDNDPVQVGRIHNGGGGDPARNLLDFFDMTADAQGRIVITYTDGCNKCSTPDTSRDRITAVAIQSDGPRLI